MPAPNLTWRMATRPPLLSRRKSRIAISPVCGQARLQVVYSATEKDVHVDSLAQLLEDEHCGAAGWAGKAKLERAVRNSSALVAAFIKTEELSQLRAAGACEPTLQHETSKLTLVGFARASSDSAFAATVHNVIVHPVVRRRGIGRSLLARLTAQLKRNGVTDIGLVAPEPSWGFFSRVDFDKDRELSTPLRYVRNAAEPYVY